MGFEQKADEGIAAIAFGAVGMTILGLLDDKHELRPAQKFAGQLLIAFIVAWAGVRITLFIPNLVFSYCVTILWLLTVINAFNFMDGIDGLAGVQGVVAGLAWWVCARYLGAPAAGSLGLVLAAGAMGFLTLNWPPAKIFMGDAGSTVLGFSFAVLPLLVWVEARPPSGFFSLMVVGLLLVWPFWADGAFTILRRLRKRENIFKAHRSHLYQRLVIAGLTHRIVTLVYGILAVIGALLCWPIIRGLPWAVPFAGFVVLVLFLSLWRWTVECERRAAAQQRTDG